jgi:hypothetical protein
MFFKSRFSREAKIIGVLKPLLTRYRWVVMLLIFLGALTSLAQGISFSLFIPLLYSLKLEGLRSQPDSWLSQFMERLLSYSPQSDKLAIICLGIFALVLLKSALSFGTAFTRSEPGIYWSDNPAFALLNEAVRRMA